MYSSIMERDTNISRRRFLAITSGASLFALLPPVPGLSSPEWLAVSPYGILEIAAVPDKVGWPHPKLVRYQVMVKNVCMKPLQILKAEARLLTRPAGEYRGFSLDFTSWESRSLKPAEQIGLAAAVPYGSGFENCIATQDISLTVCIKSKEPETRILKSRIEVMFGEPPAPTRGGWPVEGIIRAIEKYEGNYHNVWQQEYRRATGTAIDIGADIGTPVFSPFAGEVATMCSYINPSYGNQVLLTTPEGIGISFAHLSKYWDGSERAGIEKTVTPGELIGFVGKTGSGAGYPHLHYEVHGMDKETLLRNYLRIYDILPKNPQPHLGQKVKP